MPISSDPFLILKLGVVGCVLAIATATIGYDAIVFHGGPTEAEVLLMRRQAAENAQTELVLKVSTEQRVSRGIELNRQVHEQSLETLRTALGPKAESRCAGHNRRELRDALRGYVANRAAAQDQTARDPAYPDLGKAWDTPDDAAQLADARGLWREGYIVADDLQPWTQGENAIFDITEPVVSKCFHALGEAMNEDPFYHPSPRPEPSPPYQAFPRRNRRWN